MRRARSIADASPGDPVVASSGGSPGSDPFGPEGTWGVDTVPLVRSRRGQHSRRKVRRTWDNRLDDETTDESRPSFDTPYVRRGEHKVKRSQPHGERRRAMRGRLVVTGVLLAALVVSACGSGTSTAKAPTTTP